MTARHAPQDTTALHFDLIVPAMTAANQKQLIRMSAREVSKIIGIGERILAERLADREKSSPSAMGEGIAITHLHISGLTESVNVFIKLKTAIDMGAADKKPVDLVCMLLTPEREGASYLRSMARISRLLRNTRVCAMLRSAEDEKALRAVLEQPVPQQMAA
jgi:PTS system nitrogen regulatory IIA component